MLMPALTPRESHPVERMGTQDLDGQRGRKKKSEAGAGEASPSVLGPWTHVPALWLAGSVGWHGHKRNP